jgi:hypothetical protein
MSADDGKKIQAAIRAVCQMHSDVSKLLLDFDEFAPWPFESVFGNSVTKYETSQARATYWMSEGVYRYLYNKTQPGLVEAITVCFIDSELVEPSCSSGECNMRWARTGRLLDFANHGTSGISISIGIKTRGSEFP